MYDLEPLLIKYIDYEISKIFSYFQELKPIKPRKQCFICLNEINLENNQTYIVNCCWRYRATSPKYDIRINLREGSVFEGMRILLN